MSKASSLSKSLLILKNTNPLSSNSSSNTCALLGYHLRDALFTAPEPAPVTPSPNFWFTVHGLQPQRISLSRNPASIRFPSFHQHLSQRGFSAQPLPQSDSYGTQYKRTEKEDHSAEAADRAIEDYDKLLDRQKMSYPPNYMSFSKRAKNAMAAVYSFAKLSVRFTLGLPGNIFRAVMLPMDVKKKWIKKQWKHIKEGSYHYWIGTKLLAMDIRIASRLVVKVLRGKELSRRESKQLARTVSDLFRLVPMIIFLLVPFLEFLLPLALKLFPNMLPSTFEDKLKKEEELKKKVVAKMEVARFLQDTVAAMARDLKKKRTGAVQASAEELYQFMKALRSGSGVDNHDILKFAQLFNNELTLDNLERIHLVGMCQFLGLSPFGTDNFLRTRLRSHLAYLKGDDSVIRQEGLETMTDEELRSACRARGIRTPFGEGARTFMISQMKEWLELSLDRSLPSSLLILSRAFMVTQPFVDPKKKEQVEMENIAKTLATLPDETVEDVHMEVLKDKTVEENARLLEYLKREEELIKEELEEKREEEEIEVKSREAVEEKEAEAANRGVVVTEGSKKAVDMAATTTAAAVVQAVEAQAVQDMLKGSEESEEEKLAKLAMSREKKIKSVLNALAVLTSRSGVASERSRFMGLVQREIDRIQKEIHQKGGASLLFSSKGLEAWRPEDMPDISDDKAAKYLSDKVAKMMHTIETELDEIDAQIGGKLHIIDKDGDGMISEEELQTALGYLREQLGEPELKALLEELCKAAQKDSRIDIKQLMSLANERLDASKVEN